MNIHIPFVFDGMRGVIHIFTGSIIITLGGANFQIEACAPLLRERIDGIIQSYTLGWI